MRGEHHGEPLEGPAAVLVHLVETVQYDDEGPLCTRTFQQDREEGVVFGNALETGRHYFFNVRSFVLKLADLFDKLK